MEKLTALRELLIDWSKMRGMEGTASAWVEKKLLSPVPNPAMKMATAAAICIHLCDGCFFGLAVV